MIVRAAAGDRLELVMPIENDPVQQDTEPDTSSVWTDHGPQVRSPCQEFPRSMAQKVKRNGPCPCGSGRKYKKCCLGVPSSESKGAGLTPTAPDGLPLVPAGDWRPSDPDDLDLPHYTLARSLEDPEMLKRMGRVTKRAYNGLIGQAI